MPFARTPYFCSGCPHNTSTTVPEGSRALAGIGCHYLAQFMDRSTATFTQMGGEGVPWIGQAPFTETPHVFANLGDGTYTHSGILAIRAAVAAKVNITYKLLFNDAVAMTGGQPIDGGLTVPRLTRQLAAEGVERIVVVTDEPDKYPSDGRFRGRYRRPPSRRPRRRAARIARHPGRHRDGLRPDLRRRKAPPPQARPFPRPGQARLYQRSGLRGLRRLLEDLELRLGGAGRNRIRPQAGDRPIELQQGLLLRRGLLPELCDRPWRRPQKAPGGRSRRRRPAASARAGASRSRPALRHSRDRRRRDRRRYDRRAARHGGASRRQGLHRPRHDRPRAKGRCRLQPCANRRTARPDPCGADRRRQRPIAVGLRSRRFGQRRRALKARAGSQPGDRQQPRNHHRRLHPQPRSGVPDGCHGAQHRRGDRTRQRRVPRCDPARDRIVRRFDRQQSVHARLCLSARAGAVVGRGDRARDRIERGRRRVQPQRLPLGPARRRRPGAGRSPRDAGRCPPGEPPALRNRSNKSSTAGSRF